MLCKLLGITAKYVSKTAYVQILFKETNTAYRTSAWDQSPSQK